MQVRIESTPNADNHYTSGVVKVLDMPISGVAFDGVLGMCETIAVFAESPMQPTMMGVVLLGMEAGELFGALSHAHARHLQSAGLTL